MPPRRVYASYAYAVTPVYATLRRRYMRMPLRFIILRCDAADMCYVMLRCAK